MPTTETIIGDPNDFISGRTALPFDELGLKVVDADWGDADHELFLVRQLMGEIPADRHPPNRTVSIKLQAREVEGSGMPLGKVLYRLQQKVGLWQQEGGWVKRVLDEDGKYKSAVGFIVHTAVLGNLGGWLMAHRNVAPEITLVLTLGPYCYATEEQKSGSVAVNGNGAALVEIANVKGTAPGLIRATMKNESGAGNHFRALLFGIESRDHPQDGTKSTFASLNLNAVALTLGAKASKAALTGAAGGEAVKVTESTTTYQNVLSSKTVAFGGGDLTHVGTRRLWCRIYYENKPGNDVTYRLRYRQQGSPYWTVNKAVTIYGKENRATGFYYIDLGECRLDKPILGNKAWEFKLQMKKANSEAMTWWVDDFYFLPTEQFLTLSNPPQVMSPETWAQKTEAGTIATGGFGLNTEWTNPGNAKTSDNLYAEAKNIGWGHISEYLKFSKWGFAIPEGATITGIVVEVERSASVTNAISDYAVFLGKAGSVQSKVDQNRLSATRWPGGDTIISYGGSEDLWANTWTQADINAEGFGFWIVCQNQNPTGEPATAKIDQVKVTVYYSESTDESAICFQSRSIQVRSDGVLRQHASTENWGVVVPDSGFLPWAPPSGLEARAMRAIFAPAMGDLERTPDGSWANKKYTCEVLYRPGYHFTSETE